MMGVLFNSPFEWIPLLHSVWRFQKVFRGVVVVQL